RSAVDPRHAWMLFDEMSECSIPMEIHPRMAWIYRVGCRPTVHGKQKSAGVKSFVPITQGLKPYMGQ
ncbi:hypothetical protein, partial [Stenotrophomonas maltophilia]|uniref:hypothetical protein n=1 Tax=Stenotrophomonas maltophilia TaxID=40324 RepID=UPI00195364D9